MWIGTDGSLLRIDVVGLYLEGIFAQGRSTSHWHLASIMGFVGLFFDILLGVYLIIERDLRVNFSTLLGYFSTAQPL
jgi:hypothetical protein